MHRVRSRFALVWLGMVAGLARLEVGAADAGGVETNRPAARGSGGLEFIDTGIENASPLWYDATEDGATRVHLVYDRERSSPNRAAGHVHFVVQAPAGSRQVLEITNLDNVWNGTPGSVAREMKALVVSADGRRWESVSTEAPGGSRVRLAVTMPGPRLHVARVEPYRISDLETFLGSIRGRPEVEVEVGHLGRTVQGRELEIVRVGREDAAYRVFVRARAHPWEAGGNWVVEGLVRRLTGDDERARGYRARYCVYVLPMANKDGVALGRTRFNVAGKDLNRDWDRPADAELAPENAALERWLAGMVREGRAPHLALELHNDGNGQLHVSRPPVPMLARHVERMGVLEGLLRRHTWFTEGSTRESFRNAGTLGDGWVERYGVDAVVHEFNCQWIAGLGEAPLGRHWVEYGAKLAEVFDAYFAAVRP